MNLWELTRPAPVFHAEYYDMQATLDQLYIQSKNGNNFYKLTKLMVREENIRLAYRNIKKNMGSHTAGVDGKTIADIEKLTIDEVIIEIRKMFEWYEPGKVRRVFIPKPDGKKRPPGFLIFGTGFFSNVFSRY